MTSENSREEIKIQRNLARLLIFHIRETVHAKLRKNLKLANCDETFHSRQLQVKAISRNTSAQKVDTVKVVWGRLAFFQFIDRNAKSVLPVPWDFVTASS